MLASQEPEATARAKLGAETQYWDTWGDGDHGTAGRYLDLGSHTFKKMPMLKKNNNVKSEE